MKAEVLTSVSIKLTLSETEAAWLRDYMQNPRVSTSQESMTDKVTRQALYMALKSSMQSSINPSLQPTLHAQ